MSHVHVNSTALKPLLAILGLVLSCQTGIAGGDSYTIYLNGKLIFTQHVGQSSLVTKNIRLDKTNYNDHLAVNYSHCGTGGKGRTIVVEDDKNNVLKEWKFADASDKDISMSIPVKDILELRKNNGNVVLNLYYYSSKYLPKGCMLATIQVSEKNLTIHRSNDKNDWLILAAGLFGLMAVNWVFGRV